MIKKNNYYNISLEKFNNIIRFIKKIPKKYHNHWVTEIEAGLRDVILIYNEIEISQTIDPYLVNELGSIICVYLELIEQKLKLLIREKNLTYEEVISCLDLGNMNVGRRRIIDAAQHWVLGSRSLFEAPNYGLFHRGSSIKIDIVYSIILNVFEDTFCESMFNQNRERVSFFCLPIIAGETTSKVLFPDLDQKLGRLISVEISVGAFFDFSTGIALVAHEAGHYLISGDRRVRNNLLLELLCDELAYILAFNLLWLPTEIAKEHIARPLVKHAKNIFSNWLKSKAESYICKEKGENFILREYQAILESFMNSFDDLANNEDELMSLSDELVLGLDAEINNIINIHNASIASMKISPDSTNEFIEKLLQNLFASGLNKTLENETGKIKCAAKKTKNPKLLRRLKELFTDYLKIPQIDLQNKIAIKKEAEFSTECSKVNFFDLGLDFIIFISTLFKEIKADYFMISVLGLSISDYEFVMKNSPAYIYSVGGLDADIQYDSRLRILIQTDCFQDEADKIKMINMGRDDINYDYERDVANYLSNSTSDVIKDMVQKNTKLANIRKCYKSFLPLKTTKENSIFIENKFITDIINISSEEEDGC